MSILQRPCVNGSTSVGLGCVCRQVNLIVSKIHRLSLSSQNITYYQTNRKQPHRKMFHLTGQSPLILPLVEKSAQIMTSVTKSTFLSFSSRPLSYMEGLHIFLVVLLGVISCSHDGSFGSVSEVTVRPGDNITLYCDCNVSSVVYIVWFRNCSHENQPTLQLSFKSGLDSINYDFLRRFPRFQFLRNHSSESYDLLISNITDSDEGLYYCGTQQIKVEDEKYINSKYIYSYGNITTRIRYDNSSTLLHCEAQQDCGLCWTLLFSLCPVFAVLSSLLSSVVVYHLCQRKAKELHCDQQRPDSRGQTRLNQDEDVCYAALDFHQASQRPKQKKAECSDFSTYSAINTSQL